MSQLETAKNSIDAWHLGKTSSRYESNGDPATISTGKGDLGGVSYGAYQLSSKAGTLGEYLEQSKYASHFSGLAPATPEFNEKWRHLARTDPDFANDQHSFIGSTHYAVQLEKLKATGIDVSDRGRAVHDALWSTSVQFRHRTPQIFHQGIVDKFGTEFDLSKLTDKDIVESVQDYKINNNSSLFRSSPTLWPGLLHRANAERSALVELADHESTLAKHGSLPDWRLSTSLPSMTRTGDPTIASIQQNLNTLGITDARGEPLVVDGLRGGPGSRTNEAIAAFQRQTSLPGDLPGQQTPAGLLAATEAALDARDPMRRLNRPHDDNGLRIGTGAAAQPQPAASQSHTGLPDFLMQTRRADAPTTTAPTTSTPQQAGRAPPAQGREVPATSEAATAALPALPQSGLQPGDRGRNVITLQQHLHALGATDRDGRPLQADGHYGQRTQDAVEQFQLWSGREANGVADKDTLQALAAQSRFAALQREQGVGPGRHLADNLAPSGPVPLDAAELRYPSVVASANTRNESEFRSFSQPEHPQHALYSQLKSVLPEYTSEQRLAQFTAALHVDGIRPGDLKAIDVSAERAQFTTRWGASTSIDLAMARPPSIEQSLHKVESHNQELQEQAAQRAQAERQQPTQAVQY
jgi:peptidoglycan hydrolase-like protein with peptidoglycan-binding domain